jgi:hypothetical protein
MLASKAFRRLPNPSAILNPSFSASVVSRSSRRLLSADALSHSPSPHGLAQALPPIRNTTSTFRPSLRGLRKPRNVRHNATRPKPDPTPNLNSPEPSLSFSQRLKKLSKEYGWTAVGVYLGLSVLDFPFCFLAVRLLGTDRIGRWEHAIIDGFWSVVYVAFPKYRKQHEAAAAEQGYSPPEVVAEANEAAVSVEDASKTNISTPPRNVLVAKSLRSLDAVGVGLRCPQVLHLHPSSLDGCYPPKGGEDLTWLGLEYRAKKAWQNMMTLWRIQIQLCTGLAAWRSESPTTYP